MNFNLSLGKNFWAYLVLAALGLFVIFPLSVAFSQSFMTNQEVNRWPPLLIPTEPNLDSYELVLTQQDETHLLQC